MPNYLRNDMFENDSDLCSLVCIFRKDPLRELLLLVTGFDVNAVLLLPLVEALLGRFSELSAIEAWTDNVNSLFIAGREETIGLARTPFHTVNDFVV